MDLDAIVGQDHAIEILRATLAAGRLHHALIFHGPTGVGKMTTALALARIVLCHDAQPDLAGRLTACGACASCRLFGAEPEANPVTTPPAADTDADTDGAGAHPDLHVVTKELALYSDDRAIRERKLLSIPREVLERHLIDPVYRAAQLRHGKVFIVDEAELLNPAGQNVLLKTLEEPPAGTHIVLITSSEDRLLPTIRSRCQRVAFVPLPDEVIREALERDARVREQGWSPQQLQWAVDFAAGSLGRARLALDHGLLGWAEAVLPAIDAMTHGRYPTGLGAGIAASIDEFAKGWVDTHENASKDAANRQGAGLMWAMVAQHARRRLAGAAAAAPRGDTDIEATEAAVAPWLAVIDAVGEAEAELAANVNPGLVADHAVSLLYRALAPTPTAVPR